MKRPTIYPTTIELVREARRLRVEWEDGHESVYSLRYLRGFCPCAHCQGHGQGLWHFVPTDDPLVTKIEEVGSYAVSITFSDGHATGIYSFEILRELCPCAACREEQGPAHAVTKLPPGETA
jgi:DUF971 family protein